MNPDYAFLLNYTEPRPLEPNVGDDGVPESAFPLLPCQGDCDSSRDCAGPLECFHRDSTNQHEPIPGCLGSDEDSYDDYCVWPENYVDGRPLPGPHPPMSDGFAIRLYWQAGYLWQDDTRERKYCMTRDLNEDMDGPCWNGIIEIPCDSNSVYIDRCDGDDERQRFVMEPVSSDEVLIHAVYTHHDEINNNPLLTNDTTTRTTTSPAPTATPTTTSRCLERRNRFIWLRDCDKSRHEQRWFATRGGFNDAKFELSQKRMPQYCVSQGTSTSFLTSAKCLTS